MKQYAFLNTIYTRVNGESVYEVVYSETDFSHILTYRTDLAGLRKIAQSPDVYTDFVFEGEFLKCTSVYTVPINSIVEASIGRRTIFLDRDENSILDLLEFGVKEGYSILAEELCEAKQWSGDGLTGFEKIQFSKSSMSVFYEMAYNGKNLRNYIIEMSKGILRVNGFYFVVPETNRKNPPLSEYLRDITINNVKYRLYKSATSNVMKNQEIISGALINKASCKRERLKSSIAVINKFCQKFYRQGGKSYEVARNGQASQVFYGVNFDCTFKKLNEQEIDAVLSIYNGLKKDLSFQEFEASVETGNERSDIKAILKQLAAIDLQNDSTAEKIGAYLKLLSVEERQLFYTDLFLYRVRAYLFYTGMHLADTQPILFGSNESGNYTVVKEGLFYGDGD